MLLVVCCLLVVVLVFVVVVCVLFLFIVFVFGWLSLVVVRSLLLHVCCLSCVVCFCGVRCLLRVGCSQVRILRCMLCVARCVLFVVRCALCVECVVCCALCGVCFGVCYWMRVVVKRCSLFGVCCS